MNFERLQKELHTCNCLLSGIISLLKWKSANATIQNGQDYLVDSIVGDPSDTEAVWEAFDNIVVKGNLTTFKVPGLLGLVGLVDNCFRTFPRCAHLATTVISFCVTYSPSSSLSQLDPDSLLQALIEYVSDIAPRVCNADCIVEERFGITELLNTIPLLYFLGDWSESAALLAKYEFPQAIASLAVNIIHSATSTEHDTPEQNLLRFPELHAAKVHVFKLLCTETNDEGVQLVGINIMATTAIALIEILARWQSHCGISVSSARIACTDVESESVADCLLEYLPNLEELTQDCPSFSFVIPIVKAFGERGTIRQPEIGILRHSLLHASMRCALQGCYAHTNLKICKGNCHGLARYCCTEHQKKDWGNHKKFCKRT